MDKTKKSKVSDAILMSLFLLCLAAVGMFLATILISCGLVYDNNQMLKKLVDRADQEQKVEEIVIIKEPEITTTAAVITEPELIATEAITKPEDTTVVLFYDGNNTETQGKSIGEDVILPELPTNRKVCTDYRVYNILGTPHNRMQLAAWTDEQGCRRYGDYYIVGLGSAYSDRIGETFEIELETGVVFRIITGDMKADCDTDVTNRFGPCYNYEGEYCANILEFIIDKETMSKSAYAWGGVDYYDNFKGNIVRMTYLGRDTSADWDTYN